MSAPSLNAEVQAALERLRALDNEQAIRALQAKTLRLIVDQMKQLRRSTPSPIAR